MLETFDDRVNVRCTISSSSRAPEPGLPAVCAQVRPGAMLAVHAPLEQIRSAVLRNIFVDTERVFCFMRTACQTR